MRKIIEWRDLGLIEYNQAFEIQRKIHEKCWQGAANDCILFQQNDPVITVSKGADLKNLLWDERRLAQAGIQVQPVGRGGDVSYHGPGQLVISTIMHFLAYTKTAHEFLRKLEQTALFLLEKYDIQGRCIEGKTGVFVGKEKIAAIGLAVSHSVTMHGLSINVSPNLAHYEAIVPCGLVGMGVTSLEKLGCPASVEQVRDDWLCCFAKVFGCKIEQITRED